MGAARRRSSCSVRATTAAALRFGGGAVRWFEVDRPATLEDKRRRLAELGVVATGITTVGLDLLEQTADDTDAALGAAGHDADAPSLFVCDGLFEALTLGAGGSLLRRAGARAAPGSVLVANFTVAPEGGVPVRARAFRLRPGAPGHRRAAAQRVPSR